MNNKNYIDYEQQVINLLESQIKKEDKEANTASNYTRFFEEYNGKYAPLLLLNVIQSGFGQN